jgi:hypothetical protein
MTVEPAVTPVTTMDVVVTLAIDGEGLVSTPPETESTNVIVLPTQTVEGPLRVPALDGAATTVTA